MRELCLGFGAVFIGAAFVACGGGDGDEPGCGDGVCDLGENSTTCAIDCPAGPPTCTTSPDNCTGETICIASKCEAAFPRVYQMRTISVSVPNFNQGQAWDADGSAPDLFLARPNGTALTVAVPNSLTASFPGPLDFSLIAGSTLHIVVWDEDLTAHDQAFSCSASPITAAQLRTRTFNCSGAFGALSSTITPK